MPLVKDFENNTKSLIQISQKMFTHGKSPKFKYESSMNDLNAHLMNDLTDQLNIINIYISYTSINKKININFLLT